MLVHIDPFVHKSLIPLLGQRVVHHIAVDRPHRYQFVTTIAEGSVRGLHRAHQRRHDKWPLRPAIEHLRALANQFSRISTYLLNRLAKRQDMIDTGLGYRCSLGQ